MKKLTKLERVYEDINQTYSEATEEQIQEKIEDLQKEIDGKKISLEKIQFEDSDKSEQLQKNIDELEKRVNNLKGYSKNRTQITKIKEYKATLEQKLLTEVEKKKSYESNLKTLMPQLKEVLDKLKDEKYTMSLDQYEYNDLLEKREVLSNAVITNRENNKESAKRIMELKSKIGKCDLAWKTLFVNKDWDEIQKRSNIDSHRYTRKTGVRDFILKYKNKMLEEEEKDKMPEPKKSPKIEEHINDTKENKEHKAENLPVPVSRWAKVKNFFKNIQSKFKAAFGKEEIPEVENTTKDSRPETRDQFLEGLRQYADTEYRQKVRDEKQKAYLKAHEKKSKENDDMEK